MEKASLSPVTYRAAVGDDDEGKIGFLEGWERCSVIHLVSAGAAHETFLEEKFHNLKPN
jgi:hypothetical protein